MQHDIINPKNSIEAQVTPFLGAMLALASRRAASSLAITDFLELFAAGCGFGVIFTYWSISVAALESFWQQESPHSSFVRFNYC